MINLNEKLFQRLAAVTALTFMGLGCGCVDFAPVVDTTSFYVMGETERPTLETVTTRVAVRDVHLADFLENSQIVERTASNEIRYLSQHRWAGDLDSMIAQVVAEELESSTAGLYATAGDSPDADFNLDVTILQFVRTEDGGVVVSLEYRIADARTKDLVQEGRVTRSDDNSSSSVKRSVSLLESQLREAVQVIAADFN